MKFKNVLVYSEDQQILLQLLNKGDELASKLHGELVVHQIGYKLNGVEEISKYGAEKIYVSDDKDLELFSIERYRASLLEVVMVVEPHVILFGATKRGKELAARLAAALDTGCMTECISLELDDKGKLIAERLTYGGSTVATEISENAPHVASVPARVFNKPEPTKKKSEIISLTLELPESRVKVLERKEKSREETGLEDAPIIVSAGRGFKEKEDLKLLEEMAKILGAKMGCTRPVAADLGWMEDWIGISGHKVSPKLYLACGISGTIQHAAGIRDAQIIVAINNSETANIHELSDYSIIGDIYDVIPALTKVLKEKLG